VVAALPWRCNALTCWWYSESNFCCCALFMEYFLYALGDEYVEEVFRF
jgi:hypothetical protein